MEGKTIQKKEKRNTNAIELTKLGPDKKIGFAFYELGQIDEKTTKENIISSSPKKKHIAGNTI